MMRWLKDKKKEKRSNSTGYESDGKEDDYGFEKEKRVSKSPSTRRELPPTPAAPEEKSPHIYEEIHDLSSALPLDGERSPVKNKSSKGQKGKPEEKKCESVYAPMKSKSGPRDDDISPYMVVPVDKEVRQTPTNFHRNGTPEVHCDVIVKDTHCEILLTRKPKVSAFRLGTSVGSTNGSESYNGKQGVRNNTHFCSQNRRASVDSYNLGKSCTAFNVASAALSSSSSRVNSVGASSSLSLSNFSEHPTLQTHEENEDGSASSKGIVTYSAASNFVQRATNLIFRPLGGKDPRKEVFGSDCSSDGSKGQGYSPIRNDNANVTSSQNTISYASMQSHSSSQIGVVPYASIQGQPGVMDNQNEEHYTSMQEQTILDPLSKLSYDGDHSDSKFPSCVQQTDNLMGSVRTGIIRPSSPSNSSSCTYASVTFPVEPKHYNTINDIVANSEHSKPYFGPSLSRSSSMNGAFCNQSKRFYDRNQVSGVQHSQRTPLPETAHQFDGNRNFRHGFNLNLRSSSGRDNLPARSDSTFLNNMPNQPDSCNHPTPYSSAQNDVNSNHQFFHPNGYRYLPSEDLPSSNAERDNNSQGAHFLGLQDSNRNELAIEFCACSDDHSSTYGCQRNFEEDTYMSPAKAANEGSNSCKGCGRLIRQITYSESFSDETYEHVYASRLLIRRGRRYSSPDITYSEISNSEFKDIPKCGSPELQPSKARDDSWLYGRHPGVLEPEHSPQDSELQTNDKVLGQAEGVGSPGNSESQSQFQDLKEKSKCKPSNAKMLLKQCLSPVSSDSSSNAEVNNVSSQGLVLSLYNGGDRDGKDWVAEDDSNVNGQQVLLINKNKICDSMKGKTCVNVSLSSQNISIASQNPVHATKQNQSNSSYVVPPQEQDQNGNEISSSESKVGALSGLLNRFSRTKSGKSNKNDLISNNCFDRNGKSPGGRLVTEPEKDLEEIPEKNTRKLSKFFQLLSSKDTSKFQDDTRETLTQRNLNLVKNSDHLELSNNENYNSVFSSQNNVEPKENMPGSLFCPQNDSKDLKRQKHIKDVSTVIDCYESHFDNQESRYSMPQTDQSNRPDLLSEMNSLKDDKTCEAGCQSPLTQQKFQNGGAQSSLSQSQPVNRAQNKTDSGDTCYEYDISTSSDGEQTNYEDFLSKVEKTLNLEQEVQHIANSRVARKKTICKRCRKGGLYSVIGDDNAQAPDDDDEEFCPHLSAKFGDLRAMLDDMVVDQRAAILDCWTDLAHNPYNLKHRCQDNHCRECGSEIMTSDTESMTTVYSLLSQQFSVTSQGAKTPSCDSDDGTMADNSDESADEDANANIENNKDEGSSGYDEPEMECDKVVGVKVKKRKGKRDKHKFTSSGDYNTFRSPEKSKRRTGQGNGTTKHHQETIHKESKTESSLGDPAVNKQGLSSIKCSSIGNLRKDTPKKSSSPFILDPLESFGQSGFTDSIGGREDSKEDDLDHPRPHDVNRSRACLVTDKALQDIYSRLPSKALSPLTSRNYGSPSRPPCACAKALQAPIVTPDTPMATGGEYSPRGDNPGPPTVNTEKDPLNGSQPSPFDGNTNDQVGSVQTHLDCVGERGCCGEVLIHGKMGDYEGRRNEYRKLNPLYKRTFVENVISNEDALVTKPPIVSMSAKEGVLVSKNGESFTGRKDPTGLDTHSDFSPRRPSFPTESCENQARAKRCLTTHSPEKDVGIDRTPSQVPLNFEHAIPNQKYTRKYRIELATLDLLPETALRGDDDDKEEVDGGTSGDKSTVGDHEIPDIASMGNKISKTLTNDNPKHSMNNNKSDNRTSNDNKGDRSTNFSKKDSPKSNNSETTGVTKKSKVVEKMVLMFEGTHGAADCSNLHTKTSSGHKVAAGADTEQDKQRHSSNTGARLSTFTEQSNKERRPGQSPCSPNPSHEENGDLNIDAQEVTTNKMLTDPTQSDCKVKKNESGLDGGLGGEDLNLKAGSLPIKSTNLHGTPTSRRFSGEINGKLTGNKSPNNEHRAVSAESNGGKRTKTMRSKLEGDDELRESSLKSPTPSSSSSCSSSTSNNKARKGHSKCKRLHKKSYHRKRSKSRSERNKASSSKEERTYYYFSSDFSDIDTVEVDDWDTYSTKMNVLQKASSESVTRKQSSSASGRYSRKKKNKPSHDVTTDVTESGTDKMTGGPSSDITDDQEIYAIPPSSKDLRGEIHRNESSSSTVHSPQLPKARRSKKMEVYKTRKSNNKLLSDVIIKNHDMLVYGNV